MLIVTSPIDSLGSFPILTQLILEVSFVMWAHYSREYFSGCSVFAIHISCTEEAMSGELWTKKIKRPTQSDTRGCPHGAPGAVRPCTMPPT